MKTNLEEMYVDYLKTNKLKDTEQVKHAYMSGCKELIKFFLVDFPDAKDTDAAIAVTFDLGEQVNTFFKKKIIKYRNDIN